MKNITVNILNYENINKEEWDYIAYKFGKDIDSIYDYQEKYLQTGYKVYGIGAYENGKFIGGLYYALKLNFIFCKILVGGIFALDDRVDVVELLIKQLKKVILFKAPLFNIIIGGVNFKFEGLLQKYFKYSKKIGTIIIDITKSEDELRKKLNKGTKWGINKAKKDGLYCEIVEKNEDWMKAYEIYKEMCIRKELNIHSFDEFSSLKEIKKLLIIKKENDIIGGSILICFGNSIKLNYNFSKTEYYKSQPNNLLYWESILFGKENGYSFFDLGGISLEKDDGITIFKRRWGGEEYHYNKYSTSPIIFNIIPKLGKIKNRLLNRK
ncbi:lipid II:glycine glycyltransferase FemX [Haliovirga abyssi]|uniref:Peptidoglycan bridge formation glycyltransferase FemA/FemB family protein n=1 Tax=Haliovirga abyssi TaxID=2996794 RepID=A0AAU9DCQ7_9FUSO|nr:peptidoglycan bridge formation glycyltransferase FemA/FemB family protein [Haliovirga abyssi]BDU51115.1 hypothetical protein HLVA_16840 [Haliovirga abyssi]